MLAGALALASPTLAVPPPYPSPPPSFAHAGSPHSRYFSTFGGTTPRKMLVVFVQFKDVPTPTLAGGTRTWAANRFFGSFPSVADYYRASSIGRLLLTPAAESQGVANDGIVEVTVPLYVGYTAGGPGSELPGREAYNALRLADGFVDFSAFDTRPPYGVVDNSELVIVAMRTGLGNGGATRSRGLDGWPNVDTVLDGKTIDLGISATGTGTNLMTNIHEVAHQVVDIPDIYGLGAGHLALGGQTTGWPDATLFFANAWEKLHLGWATPGVAVRDGYYNLTSGYGDTNALVVYDPARGPSDYFVIENRQQTPGTYDQGASDSGLVIWRVDDATWGSSTARYVELMRPDGTTTPGCTAAGCYSGSTVDAWDPLDPTTVGLRTMSRRWRDGTPSNVAVRAIGRSGRTIRAYVDVRGAGILVDAFALANRSLSASAMPAGRPTEIPFPVMNTQDAGEPGDTFAFTIYAPAGWGATSQTMALAPTTPATARVSVTPPSTAAGLYTLTAVGWSVSNPGVRSSSAFQVFVPPTVAPPL